MTKNTIIGELVGKERLVEDNYRLGNDHNTHIIHLGGLCIDTWNSVTSKVTCLSAFVNDALDKRKVNARWIRKRTDNGEWTTWLQCIRPLEPDEQILVSYGARYWCHKRHPPELLTKVIHAYNIDITTSTAESHGNWRGLPADLYADLLRNTNTQRSTTTMTVRGDNTQPHRVKGTLLQYFIAPKLQQGNTARPSIPMSNRKRGSIMAVRTFLRPQHPVPPANGNKKKRSQEALRKFIFPQNMIGSYWRDEEDGVQYYVKEIRYFSEYSATCAYCTPYLANDGRNALVLATRHGTYEDHLIFDYEYVRNRVQCYRNEMRDNNLAITERQNGTTGIQANGEEEDASSTGMEQTLPVTSSPLEMESSKAIEKPGSLRVHGKRRKLNPTATPESSSEDKRSNHSESNAPTIRALKLQKRQRNDDNDNSETEDEQRTSSCRPEDYETGGELYKNCKKQRENNDLDDLLQINSEQGRPIYNIDNTEDATLNTIVSRHIPIPNRTVSRFRAGDSSIKRRQQLLLPVFQHDVVTSAGGTASSLQQQEYPRKRIREHTLDQADAQLRNRQRLQNTAGAQQEIESTDGHNAQRGGRSRSNSESNNTEEGPTNTIVSRPPSSQTTTIARFRAGDSSITRRQQILRQNTSDLDTTVPLASSTATTIQPQTNARKRTRADTDIDQPEAQQRRRRRLQDEAGARQEGASSDGHS